jgi:hypothetical protein
MVQDRRALPAEEASWPAPAKVRYAQMTEGRQRGVELRHHQRHRRTCRQRTALVGEGGQPWETEGHVPQAPYACDNGVCSVALPRLIERGGPPGGSDSAGARHSHWRGQGRRVDQVAAEVRGQQPERVRPVTVPCRTGEEKQYWVCTQGGR